MKPSQPFLPLWMDSFEGRYLDLIYFPAGFMEICTQKDGLRWSVAGRLSDHLNPLLRAAGKTWGVSMNPLSARERERERWRDEGWMEATAGTLPLVFSVSQFCIFKVKQLFVHQITQTRAETWSSTVNTRWNICKHKHKEGIMTKYVQYQSNHLSSEACTAKVCKLLVSNTSPAHVTVMMDVIHPGKIHFDLWPIPKLDYKTRSNRFWFCKCICRFPLIKGWFPKIRGCGDK